MDTLADIVGQAQAIEVLRRARDEARLASAYLFAGPSGVGKRKTALALAGEVVAKDDTRAQARVSAGNHPDVRLFSPRDEGKRNIQVEQLRSEILPLARYAPYESDHCFFIFEQADVCFPDFQPEAANALLKTLEEPKRGVHYILLTERPDRLLPTILSRCQRVRFGRLPQLFVESTLQQAGYTGHSAATAAALSGGRIDRALALADDDCASTLVGIATETDDALRGAKPGQLVRAAERICETEPFPLMLDTLQVFYRDLALCALGADQELLTFRHLNEQLRARATDLSPSTAAEYVHMIGEQQHALELNANRRVVMDGLLFRMRELRTTGVVRHIG